MNKDEKKVTRPVERAVEPWGWRESVAEIRENYYNPVRKSHQDLERARRAARDGGLVSPTEVHVIGADNS